MIIYTSAIIIIIGSWYFFVKNIKNNNSNLKLCLIMLVIPFLYFFIGLQLAMLLHNEGLGYVVAALLYLLLFNSLILLVAHFVHFFVKGSFR
ncbi:hypothetical protein [Bacillus sp. SM2101]|uniref:hypothetical protein n=1 Tax=Bacillus sp. SM2101 TaxID=2805366 RepID=UPI001BDE9AFD|nr:hypothetical protein [Bacillus sp. SM2101]